MKPSDCWPVLFRDDFSTLNRSIWRSELGNNDGWGNGEQQVYTDNPENAYISADNTLHVRLLRHPTTGTWTSARLTTRGTVQFTFGRVQTRVRVERVDGPFCAVWALSALMGVAGMVWPTCGEIDIFEMQTKWGNTPASLHFGERHAGNPVSFKNKEIDVEQWHVYTMEWTPSYIAFFHDDQMMGRYDKPDQANQHNWPFHKDNPFHLIINNAIAPWFGSKPDKDLTSHVLEVDYIEIRSYPGAEDSTDATT